MRPLADKFLGNLSVLFYNGTSIVSGSIIKQLGTTKYIVSDGTIQKICALVPTTHLGQMFSGLVPMDQDILDDGMCTITMLDKDGNVAYVKKLLANTALTTEGVMVFWSHVAKDTRHIISTIDKPVAHPDLLGIDLAEYKKIDCNKTVMDDGSIKVSSWGKNRGYGRIEHAFDASAFNPSQQYVFEFVFVNGSSHRIKVIGRSATSFNIVVEKDIATDDYRISSDIAPLDTWLTHGDSFSTVHVKVSGTMFNDKFIVGAGPDSEFEGHDVVIKDIRLFGI